MAMSIAEERELRFNCSIGTLLGNLSNRDDLKKPVIEEEAEPQKEAEPEEETSGGEKKRSAEEEQGGLAKKTRDPDEEHPIDFFLEEAPDFDEGDPDWVVEEKQYLIEEYGRRMVTLLFDEKDRFLYRCEVCQVDCNQRKMLQSHCMGMRHLRKKALLDRRIQGKDGPEGFISTEIFKARKSSDASYATKPYDLTKPSDREPSESRKKWEAIEAKKKWETEKKKWNDTSYYNYPQGDTSGYYNQTQNYNQQTPNYAQQTQTYVPPPGYPGGPPTAAPPQPNYYGQWGQTPPNVYNTPGQTAPNMFNTPPPTVPVVDNSAPKRTGKDSLAGGNTGSLLQKLADCAVKNDKDSELAINVVIALMKSLKDFNHKRGETRFIEVLTEADVTFRSLKNLKPTTPPPSVSSETPQEPVASTVSDLVQGGNPSSQSSNYNNNSQNNGPPNNGYPYGNGPNYSNQNANYNQSGPNGPNQNYGQNPNQSNANYSNQGYENQGSGYYNQAQGNNQNSDGYSYPGGPYNQSSAGPQNSQGNETQQQQQQPDQQKESTNKSSGSLVPPPPPPTAASSTTDTPDLSNYGYAAGYSMGYYNVPPPAFNQPWNRY